MLKNHSNIIINNHYISSSHSHIIIILVKNQPKNVHNLQLLHTYQKSYVFTIYKQCKRYKNKKLKQILLTTYPPLCFYYLPKITNYDDIKNAILQLKNFELKQKLINVLLIKSYD